MMDLFLINVIDKFIGRESGDCGLRHRMRFFKGPSGLFAARQGRNSPDAPEALAGEVVGPDKGAAGLEINAGL